MKVQMINVEKKKQSKKYKGLKLLRCPELTDNDRTIKNRELLKIEFLSYLIFMLWEDV